MSASYYFHFIDHKCNVTLSAQGDTLQSPNYPANYPNGVICHTLIEAPKGLVVWLNIVNFSLQSDGSEQGICTNDYDTLTFYDGPNESAPFLGEYCGSLIPEAFQSSGRHLLVVFKSNHNTTDTGYETTISFEGKSICISISNLYCINVFHFIKSQVDYMILQEKFFYGLHDQRE